MVKTRRGGHWSEEESALHINVLELIAAFYALSSLCNDIRNAHIKLMVDNQTALAYINKMGGKKTLCNKIARKIWGWCIERNVWLSSAYLTSKDNFAADEQSRISHLNSEWELDNSVFDCIVNTWGKPDVDLFASRLNHKLDKYVSWKPDPYSIGVDAFNMNWNGFFAYIFPPFSLVGKILQKIEEDKIDAILVAPLWTTQSWFGKLLHMLTDCPFFFNRNRHTMKHPHKNVDELPRMKILICCLSGRHSARSNFHNRLKTSSCPHGDTALLHNMMSTSEDGTSLLLRGMPVHLHPLST